MSKKCKGVTMLKEMKLINKYAFKLLMEAGFFDDFDDEKTEALIPYWLSPEQKKEMADRYDKMGQPYVIQTDPDDQPNPDDVMDPPRSNNQIRRDVLSTADRLQQSAEESDQKILDRYGVSSDSYSPDEPTMPLSRIRRMQQSDSTFPTGVIDDYSDYSDPMGQDAEMARMSDIEDDSSNEENTFNFDMFDQFADSDPRNFRNPVSRPPESTSALSEERLSHGALIRKKYHGRY